jgi:hypothetical protein
MIRITGSLRGDHCAAGVWTFCVGEERTGIEPWYQ